MHWDNFGWQFWHWWHGWHWWFGFYQWFEMNNLWKAAVAFFVTLILGIAITAMAHPLRAWREHKETQRVIADRLDTNTPGGLADLVKALHAVLGDLEDGEAPDDNGSDHSSAGLDHAEVDPDDKDDPPPVLKRSIFKRKRGHSSHNKPGHFEHFALDHDQPGHSSIPNPLHGGGSATHR